MLKNSVFVRILLNFEYFSLFQAKKVVKNRASRFDDSSNLPSESIFFHGVAQKTHRSVKNG